MADVLKVIEVMSESAESFEDAVRNAVKHASKSVRGIRSAYVNEQSAVVQNDSVIMFRVNVKITFEVGG